MSTLHFINYNHNDGTVTVNLHDLRKHIKREIANMVGNIRAHDLWLRVSFDAAEKHYVPLGQLSSEGALPSDRWGHLKKQFV